MRSLRYLLTLCLIVSLGTCPNNAVAARTPEMYHGAVNFGPQVVPLAGSCLWVDGGMTSGSFFDGLERRQSGTSSEYRKGSDVIREYPESVTVAVRFLNQCAKPMSDSDFADFADLAGRMVFRVDWKAGLQVTPAVLSPIAAGCIRSMQSVVGNAPLPIPSVTCHISIPSKGIPLENHLIVSVFSRSGARLTRLSAAP
jgi:hypothetical protein